MDPYQPDESQSNKIKKQGHTGSLTGTTNNSDVIHRRCIRSNVQHRHIVFVFRIVAQRLRANAAISSTTTARQHCAAEVAAA